MTESTRKKLLKKLTELLKHLKRLTTGTYYKAVELLRDNIEAGEAFTWNENGTAEKKIMNLLEILEGRINMIISSGVSDWYRIGLEEATEEITKALKGKGFIREKRNMKRLNREAEQQRRIQATAGHSRTVSYRNGALNNLSNRVWDFKGNARKEIETFVQKAIKEGKGVHAVQDDLRQWLNTGKSGEMAVKGTGIYNSVKKNCERLLRTEVMAAYRSAEVDQYQADDSVIGFTIKLSGNHMTTTGENGKPKEIHDVCDQCQGNYPKDFYWTGWHPNCRCVMVPITLTPDQFAEYMDAEDEGREKEYIEKIRIKDYPEGFKRWLKDNLSKIQKNPPQWLRANPQALQA